MLLKANTYEKHLHMCEMCPLSGLQIEVQTELLCVCGVHSCPAILHIHLGIYSSPESLEQMWQIQSQVGWVRTHVPECIPISLSAH